MAVNRGDNRSSRIIGFVDFEKRVKIGVLELAGLKCWPVSVSKSPSFTRSLINWLTLSLPRGSPLTSKIVWRWTESNL